MGHLDKWAKGKTVGLLIIAQLSAVQNNLNILSNP